MYAENRWMAEMTYDANLVQSGSQCQSSKERAREKKKEQTCQSQEKLTIHAREFFYPFMVLSE